MKTGGEMKVNAIYKEETKSCIRLCYEVATDLCKDIIWLEMPKEYDNYIVTEIIDPFCIIFCNYSMEKKENILSDVPITRECLNRLKTYIKIMSDTSEYFHFINIEAPVIEELPYKTYARSGTGCSCGVDSMYTILNVMYERKEKLTDLVLINCGNVGADRSKTNLRHFQQGIVRMNNLAKELEINSLWIDTNIHELYEREGYVGNHSIYMRLMGCIAVLGKYFETYYIAADYHIAHTKFGSVDGTEKTLIVDTQMAGNRKLSFPSIGIDMKRIEKVAYISHYPKLVGKYLSVCLFGEKPNCCRCIKCRRTMLELYICGMEGGEIIQTAFNQKIFIKNRDALFAEMLALKKDSSLFMDEAWSWCREKKIKIPARAYLMQIYYWPRYHLTKIQWLRKFYLKYLKKKIGDRI